MEQTGQAIDALAPNIQTPEPGPTDETLAALIDQGEQAIKGSQFSEAKTLFAVAQQLLPGRLGSYLIQHLVLATYKAKGRTRLEALFMARKLLEDVSPKNSNDHETLELLGNLEFALFEERTNVNGLVRDRQAYKRLYTIPRATTAKGPLPIQWLAMPSIGKITQTPLWPF